MEFVLAIFASLCFFYAGYLLGRKQVRKCQDDLENLRDILFEEEGNNYVDREPN